MEKRKKEKGKGREKRANIEMKDRLEGGRKKEGRKERKDLFLRTANVNSVYTVAMVSLNKTRTGNGSAILSFVVLEREC
jgi:hypothetical protein